MPEDVAAVVVGAKIDFALKQAARNATLSAKPAPRFIPLRGYIIDLAHPDGKRLVDGHAFEVEGFEYCHLWVTPFLERGRWLKLIASHWETGTALLQWIVCGASREEVALRAADFLRVIGHRKLRARLMEWGVKC